MQNPSSILAGTASWTDPTLLACGRFYPPHANDAASRLRHYTSQFSMVEVDASYYALPDPLMAHAWTQRTPASFVFNIKAFRAFSGHRIPAQVLPADLRRDWPGMPAHVYDSDLPQDWRDELWRRFILALEPLRMSGKLGAVQIQFAPWIHNDARGQVRLRDCAERLEGIPCAIEFRHRGWFQTPLITANTLARLRDLQLIHTVVDAPQAGSNTVPAVWDTTHPDLAVVRLHGRNHAAWNHRGAASSSRFQYVYSPEELAELARRIRRLAGRVRQAHAVFNTNHEDDGMRNAAGLAKALRR